MINSRKLSNFTRRSNEATLGIHQGIHGREHPKSYWRLDYLILHEAWHSYEEDAAFLASVKDQFLLRAWCYDLEVEVPKTDRRVIRISPLDCTIRMKNIGAICQVLEHIGGSRPHSDLSSRFSMGGTLIYYFLVPEPFLSAIENSNSFENNCEIEKGLHLYVNRPVSSMQYRILSAQGHPKKVSEYMCNLLVKVKSSLKGGALSMNYTLNLAMEVSFELSFVVHTHQKRRLSDGVWSQISKLCSRFKIEAYKNRQEERSVWWIATMLAKKKEIDQWVKVFVDDLWSESSHEPVSLLLLSQQQFTKEFLHKGIVQK